MSDCNLQFIDCLQTIAIIVQFPRLKVAGGW